MSRIYPVLLAGTITATLCSPGVLAEEPMSAGWGGTELYGCEMNEGKTPADLMGVVKQWNKWSDEKNQENYFAWVLTPVFGADIDFERTAFWFGFTPNFTEMGKSLDLWFTEGAELNAKFNDVWACTAHMEFASMIVRGGGGDASSGYASFTDCSFREGRRFEDLMAATEKYNAYLDEHEVNEVTVYHLPGHGNPQDADYQMKISSWVSDLSAYGENAEKYVNHGGWKVYQDTVGAILSCDSPRMYTATLVRDGS